MIFKELFGFHIFFNFSLTHHQKMTEKKFTRELIDLIFLHHCLENNSKVVVITLNRLKKLMNKLRS